jgi:hypothetical protein
MAQPPSSATGSSSMHCRAASNSSPNAGYSATSPGSPAVALLQQPLATSTSGNFSSVQFKLQSSAGTAPAKAYGLDPAIDCRSWNQPGKLYGAALQPNRNAKFPGELKGECDRQPAVGHRGRRGNDQFLHTYASSGVALGGSLRVHKVIRAAGGDRLLVHLQLISSASKWESLYE